MKESKQNEELRVLVTGATGYIGSKLVTELIQKGHIVHIIVRQNSDLTLLDGIVKRLVPHDHDGTMESMQIIMNKVRPVAVIHLASLFLSNHQPEDITYLIKSNIEFGTQLVEAMVQNRVFNLINTGTSWQHFHNDNYNPVCLYAATKEAFGNILTYYTEVSPLQIITLKLFDTYGPNDPRKKLIPILKASYEENKSLHMSPGEQLLDLVYIDDVIAAYEIALGRLLKGEMKKNHEVYAVSSDNPIKLKDLIHLCNQVLNKELSVVFGGRPYRDREVMVPWTGGECLPNWVPKISLDEGILRTMKDFDIVPHEGSDKFV